MKTTNPAKAKSIEVTEKVTFPDATEQTSRKHKAQHMPGGDDEVTGVSPGTHAASHVNTDSIQNATAAQKGLATATQITKLNGIEASAVALATVKADADIADAITKKHAQAHTLASHSTKAHSELTGVGTSDHHTKYTDAEALAAAVQAGAITDGVTKAPTHDAVFDVKTTANGAVPKSLFDAQTILIAVTDDTPVALAVAASRIVGRKATGNIVALTGAELMAILSGQAGAAFSMNTQRITSLLAPTTAGDALRKGTALTTTELPNLTNTKMWQGNGSNRPAEIDVPSGPTVVRKAADESVNNSNVFQNDNELLFAVGANEIWRFEVYLYVVQGASDTPNFKVQFTDPVAAVSILTYVGETVGGAITEFQDINSLVDIWVELGSGATKLLKMTGLIINGANAGNWQLQWAQQTAAAVDTTVKANSCMICHQLA